MRFSIFRNLGRRGGKERMRGKREGEKGEGREERRKREIEYKLCTLCYGIK